MVEEQQGVNPKQQRKEEIESRIKELKRQKEEMISDRRKLDEMAQNISDLGEELKLDKERRESDKYEAEMIKRDKIRTDKMEEMIKGMQLEEDKDQSEKEENVFNETKKISDEEVLIFKDEEYANYSEYRKAKDRKNKQETKDAVNRLIDAILEKNSRQREKQSTVEVPKGENIEENKKETFSLENLDPQVAEGLKFFHEKGTLMVGAFQNRFNLNLADAEKLIEKVEAAYDKELEEKALIDNKNRTTETQKKEEEKITTTTDSIEEDQNNNENNIDDEEKLNEDARNRALENFRKQKATVVNIDEIAEAEARKAADAYMTESEKRLKGVKGFFIKFWKHTFVDEFYRQRQINRVREEIKNTGNIYIGRMGNNNKIAHESAMKGISDRFISDYEGTLSEGEEKKLLSDKNPEAVKAVTDIKNLISEYAQGNINEEAFKNEKTRILNTLNSEDILKGSGNYADNLFEIAKNAKFAIEHGVKLEELDLDTSIIIGRAKSSLKTEAHFSKVDKVIDKMKKSKVGRFISPAVLSTSIGLAYSLSVGLGVKLLRSKAAAYGTFGAAVAISAAFAGMNESQRIALERKQHGIEMAEGQEFEKGSKRREQMNQFQYQMESSNNLTQRLRNLMFEKDKDGNEIVKDIKKEDLDEILANLAEIEARNSLNAKKKIDLISYSSIGNVEKERTDLTILVAKAKVELRKRLETDLKDGIPAGETFDSYLTTQIQTIENSLLGGEIGIDAKDKAFRKYKAKRVAKKVAQTALVGLIIGGTVQEGLAFFKDDVQGGIESIFRQDNGAMTQTPLEHIKDWIMGNDSHVSMLNSTVFPIDGHNVNLPEGFEMIKNSDGTFNIFNGDNIASDHIELNWGANGELDSDSVARLGVDGIIASTTHFASEGVKEVVSSAQDYVGNSNGDVEVNRIGWYDNDTPKPVFDQNELKLNWGGENGTGIDSDGNHVFNIKQMTEDGSFHEQFSVNAQEAIKKGLLSMAFSLTEGTQEHVFMVPIDINGNAIIDPDSEIGKLFFTTENGHSVFKGRFAEVVQSFGQKDGAEQIKMLATHVGEGNDSILNQVPVITDIPVTNITPSMDTEPPMFIPFYARRPLEPVKYNENLYYGGVVGVEGWKEDLSPRLKNNPDAKLDPKEEIDWYFKDQQRRYPGYIEKELPRLEVQNPGPLGKKVEAVVCVAVAGHQEYNNIYNSLKTYALQKNKENKSVWGKDKDKNKFEIFLYVNWPKGQSAQKTLDEISRFKKDFPNVKIRIYTEEIDSGKVQLGWLKKKVFDLALKKHSERNINKDIIIITNDADMVSASDNYLENAVGSLTDDKNESYDAILGRYDLDHEVYKKNPTFHTVMRFWQIMEAVMRSKYGLVGSQGRNTIMRGSSYAAIGGNHIKEYWGDIEFGLKFGIARKRNAIAYSNKSWVTVDPRREIDKFKSGEKIAYTWGSDFDTRNVRGSGKSENSIPEKLDITKLAGLAEDDPGVIEFKKRLSEELQEIVNLFSSITPGYISVPNNPGIEKSIRPDIKMLANRAFGLLGIKAELVDSTDILGNRKFSLNIINTKKLRIGLKNYNPRR